MNTKKILGWLILVIFAIPLLYASIWAVGVTRGALSPKILSETPRRIVERLPGLVNTFFEEAKEPDAITDPELRLWVDAMNDADKTPKEAMEDVGLSSWLEEEVTTSLESLGRVLTGGAGSEDVKLDTAGFVEAIGSPQFENYALEVIGNLPDCTRDQAIAWEVAIARGNEVNSVPACDPGGTIAGQAVSQLQETVRQSQTAIPLSHGFDTSASGVSLLAFTNTLVQSIFILPVAALVIGVLLAADSTNKRFRAAGAAIAIAGLISLITANLAKSTAHLSLTASPALFGNIDESVFSPQMYASLVDEVGDVLSPAIDQLIDPVIFLSNMAIFMGLALIGITYLVGRNGAISSTAVEAPPDVPKKRGRPKGSKNKKKRTSR